MSDTKRFDEAAATWDSVDRRVVLAHAVVEAISSRVPLTKELAVLDFGCGTGLVTLALAPQVGSIAGADTSSGMLKILAEKAEAKRLPLRQILLDPSGGGDLGGPYDLIVSSMTLHHIADVPALFSRLVSHLNPGGTVALADLDEEDGSFHEDRTGVHHHGFPRAHIQAWLEQAGFRQVHLGTATVTHKEGQDYSVFLATAQRG
ncbi:class I SAM-dependent DNA methyltransferase [Geothrix fuzhouensis]|uniref:class I SAM-dependent DNA methyltransferase n=1 Tax=Geothrix fuzhouensis TaxID=2966451 RepID=UPI0021481FB3|nr:class I SAM-dependent methyltransferase [Geothrix fuzhouensis]